MRVGVLLALVVSCAGQASEWSQYDAAVGALCDVAEGATPQGGAPAAIDSSNIQQTSGTKMSVSGLGSPDAVWLKDSYGMIIAFQASPTGTVVLDFGTDAETVQLYAHYPSCYTVSTGFIATWKKLYNDYVTEDSNSFGSELTAAEIQSTAPAFTSVDVAAAPPTATIQFTQPAGVAIPHVYVRDSDGVVLAYSTNFAAAPGGATTRSLTFDFLASSTSLTACTLSCTTHELAGDLVASIEAAGNAASALDVCASSTCSLPTTYEDGVIHVRSSATCTGDYSLYALDGTTLLGYGHNQALTVNVAGKTSVIVKQLCGGALASMTVSVTPLQEAYDAGMAAVTPATPGSQVGALTCTADGVTYGWNDVWDGPDGSKCLCVQGAIECGGATKRGIYFDSAALVGVVLSVVIIAGAIGGFLYYQYMQKQAAGRRRNVSGQTYTSGIPGKEAEVEMPAGGRGVGVDTSSV